MATKTEPAEDAKPKKRKKLLLILMIPILLAGLGGGAAWYFVKQKADAEQQAAEEDEEEAPKVVKKKKRKKALDTQFVAMDPYFTVNLSGDDRDRFLQLGVVLEVSNPKAPDAIKAKMPLVRSEVLYLLSGKTSKELLSADGKKRLAGEILEIARAPLNVDPPDNGVEAVHFSIFVVQ